MPSIDELAEDLARVFRSPRWKFWKRDMTKQEAIAAIEAALTGEVEPIQRFGISIPKSATSPWERGVAILRQTRRYRRRNV